MSYRLHEAAEVELGTAALYYEEHATPKIAAAFLDEFERVMEILQLNQQLGTPKAEGLRAYPLRKFPYSVIYRADEEAGPQVYAVTHQHREPEYWQGRQ